MQQRRTVESVQHASTQAPAGGFAVTEDFWTRALAAVPQSAVPRCAWGGGLDTAATRRHRGEPTPHPHLPHHTPLITHHTPPASPVAPTAYP